MDTHPNFQKVDELVVQLKQVVAAAFHAGEAIDQTERTLYSTLMLLGRELVGSIIASAGDGDVGPEVEKNGRMVKRLPKRPRRYRSIFGDIHFERFVYGTAPSEAIQAIPLDEHLGLPENDYSLVLESWTGMLATESSFHRAVERLDSILGIHVPLDSSERIEMRLGKSAALLLDNMPSIDRATEAEILVQTSDNKGIPMVRPPAKVEPLGAQADRKGPVPDRKQMACMAGVYTVAKNLRTPQEIVDALFRVPRATKEERIDTAPRNPRYFASMTRYDRQGEIIGRTAEEQAQQWMTANTIRRHKPHQAIVVMHDGQHSLWNLAAQYQQGWTTIEILDLMHVLPRIWASARIVSPDSVEQFVKDQLALLLAGLVNLMLKPLKNHLRRKGVKSQAHQELTGIIHYLEANRMRMKYNEYLAAGLPIATGFIEGACRHVIKDRMERSGMRWKEKGARTMLNLRCIEASGLWNLTMEAHREVSLARYGKHRTNYSDQFLTLAS